jgi:hypothetical protein
VKPVFLPDSPDDPASAVLTDGIFTVDFSISPLLFGLTIWFNLHLFVDASPHAFGAVAYFCNLDRVAFVLSKSRVAPL